MGDLVSDLASADGGPTVSVVRELSLPFSLDDETLLVACSHSGSTRETLGMFRQALQGGTPGARNGRRRPAGGGGAIRRGAFPQN